jgi:hypothetical protein
VMPGPPTFKTRSAGFDSCEDESSSSSRELRSLAARLSLLRSRMPLTVVSRFGASCSSTTGYSALDSLSVRTIPEDSSSKLPRRLNGSFSGGTGGTGGTGGGGPSLGWLSVNHAGVWGIVSILVTESLSGALRVGMLNTGTVVLPTEIRLGSALTDRAGGGGPGGGGGRGIPGSQFTDGNPTVCGDGPADADRRAVGASNRGSVGMICTEAR